MAWTAVILAAGKGTRMASCKPKALQTLAGRTLVEHIIVKLADVAIDDVVIIHSPEAKKDFENVVFMNFEQTKNKDIGELLKIDYWTTIVVYKDNKELAREIGLYNERDIYNLIKKGI